MALSEWIGQDRDGLVAASLLVHDATGERAYTFDLAEGEQLFSGLVLAAPDVDPDSFATRVRFGEEAWVPLAPGFHSYDRPGRYDVSIAFGEAASVVVVAGILTRIRRRTSWPSFVQCEMCVQSVKAALIAALGPFALAADIPDEAIEAAAEALEWIADQMNIPADWLTDAVRQLRKISIDRLAERVCARAGLCPAAS